MNFTEFATQVNALQENATTSHNLEEFLRAMWRLVLQHQDTQPTWELFYQIVAGAWSGEPAHFDESWLEIKDSADMIEFDMGVGLDDFEYLKGTILFQIADLRRMRDTGSLEQHSGAWFFDSVESPVGNVWYNVDPESFIFNGLIGMTHSYSASKTKQILNEEVSWRYLAALLYLGQMYE